MSDTSENSQQQPQQEQEQSLFAPTTNNNHHHQQQQQMQMQHHYNNHHGGGGGRRHNRHSPIQEKEGHLLCVDPISKKMNVPLECISETLAKQRQGIPSLCMLYLNNRCRQGPNCHQVHADPSVILAMREKAQEKMICCMEHTTKIAAVDQRIKDVYHVTFIGGSGATIPITRCAMTPGLQCFIDEFEQKSGGQPPTEGPIVLNPSVTTLCRLHGQDRCRYGDDCRFFHICKELLHGELVASGAYPVSPYQQQSRNPAIGNNNNRYNSSFPQTEGIMSSSAHHYNSFNGGGSSSFYPPSPTQQQGGFTPYPGNQTFQRQQQQQGNNNASGSKRPVKQLSHESLISMDLTSTPPLTPTMGGLSSSYSTPAGNKSPVVKSRDAGDSWSYEVYGFNPIPMMPPAMESTA